MTHSDKAPTAEQGMIRRIMNDNAEYMNGVDRGQVRFGHEAVKRMIEAAIRETTARAAAVVKEYAAEAQDSYHRCLGMNAAEALECGDHLEKTHD